MSTRNTGAKVVPIHQPKLASINYLSTLLGYDWRAVKDALQGLPPAGTVSGKPAWEPGPAIRHVVITIEGRPGAGAAPASRDDLDGFTPKERRDFVASERDLLKLRQEAGQMVTYEDHRDAMVALISPTVARLAALPDVLELELGLTPVQTEKVDSVVHGMREELYQQQVEGEPGG